jgi:hypothetical protein
MRRFMLLAVAGLLGLLAPLSDAGAQGQPGVTEAQKGKLRLLAIARAPLADEHLPDGGLILALVRASLGNAGFDELGLQWTKAAPAPPMLDAAAIDVALPLEAADCDHPNDLTQGLAVLCDNAVFTDPMFQVVVALFAPADSSFKFDTDDGIFGKTVCVAQDQDVSTLNGSGRDWVAFKRVTVLRRPTLLDCVVAVQGRAANAFIAPDLEGSYLLGRLGLTQAFKMQARPLATRGVHAVVAREHPRGAELIAAINGGLKRLKQSEAYAAIVQKHLALMWDGPQRPLAAATAAAVPLPKAGAQRPPVPVPPQVKAPVPIAALPPAASGPSAVAPPPAAGPLTVLSPKAMSNADRERAQRLMKKGDEELEDGRVAPARLLYERAADMGLPQAAMALAATYDAMELSKLDLRNVQPNPAEARRWYERALALGAGDASQRLQRLGAK